jgi:hypothetical protein
VVVDLDLKMAYTWIWNSRHWNRELKGVNFIELKKKSKVHMVTLWKPNSLQEKTPYIPSSIPIGFIKVCIN